MENEEFVREFLEECEENLDQLDRDFVALEKDPQDQERLASVYRSIHTIKGSSGFFGLTKLGAIAHGGENLLSRLRNAELILNEEMTSVLLESMDAIREILSNIETTGNEGDGDYRELITKIDRLLQRSVESGNTDDIEEEGAIRSESHPITKESEASGDGATRPDESFDQESSSPVDSQHECMPEKTLALAGTGEPVAKAESKDPIENSRSEDEPPRSSDPPIATSEGSIRVDVGLLNQLVDLIGELVLARNQLMQLSSRADDRHLASVANRMNRVTTSLQERIMKTRLQPIDNIWAKFPRVVRDLAVNCGKEVELEMVGRDTELDKSLLEAIRDPLTHLLRNSIDHGIEAPNQREQQGKPRAGNLLLRAWHEGGQVNVEISDDGAGIDSERVRGKAIANDLITEDQAASLTAQQLVQLIFRPGFSTAEKVTDVSGRGVGMDVVKTNIESIGGTIDIHTQVGHGTTLRVKIPLTLAIVPALMVSCADDRFAIPQVHLVEMLRVDQSHASCAVGMIRGAPVCRLRGMLLPLVYLRDVLGLDDLSHRPAGHLNIVVLQADECRFGLVVDSVQHTEEIVVKPLHRAISVIPQLAGATVLGDGRVALILDVLGLAGSVGLESEATDGITAVDESDDDLTGHEQTLLLCELSQGRRLAVPLGEVDRLEDFAASAVEFADDQEVVQYREQIMPLVMLSGRARETNLQSQIKSANDFVGQIKTVVVAHQGRYAGVVVERVLDVIRTSAPMRPSKSNRAIQGSTVVDGQVTDILDVTQVVQLANVEVRST